MNRNIKFRVWDKDHNKWSTVRNLLLDRIQDEKYYHILLDNYKRFIFQQFTGLKDKNDKEIFEGDIFKIFNPFSYLNGDKEYLFYTVEWDKHKACFARINNNHLIEVVGNIFENPELLNE